MVAIPVAQRSLGPRAAIGSVTTKIRPSLIPKAGRRGTTRNAKAAVTSRGAHSVAPEALTIMSSEPRWIKSGGGPLICVERALAQYWLGVAANSITYGPDRTYTNDYKRACSVSDYLGKIALGNRHALILGDMPLETLIWQLPDQLPRIVRVYYADPDVAVTKRLESTQDPDFSGPVETMEVDVGSTPMIVFDSAYPGKDVGSAHLSFELPPGMYSVLTKALSPDDRTSVLVHKFVPIKPDSGAAS